MRTFIGTVMVIAALVLIVCSAITLFTTAFNSAPDQWQQWLKGTGVVAIVAWEAAAFLLIVACWRMGQRFIAFGAMLVLVAAMLVTLKQEMRLHVGVQADMVASRDVMTLDRQRINSELKAAYTRRDGLVREADQANRAALTESDRGGCGDRCQSLQAQAVKSFAEAEIVRNRIAELEVKWDTRIEHVNAGGLPEGALASRMLGGTEQFWTDVLASIDVIFWMLARVFALPLAIVGFSALRKEERSEPTQRTQEPAKAAPAPTQPPKAKQPLLGAMAKREEPVQVEPPHIIVNNDTPKSKAYTMQGVNEQDVRLVLKWIDGQSDLVAPGEAKRITGVRARKHFDAWRKRNNKRKLSQETFGKVLSAIGVEHGQRISSGVTYIFDRTAEVASRTAAAA